MSDNELARVSWPNKIPFFARRGERIKFSNGSQSTISIKARKGDKKYTRTTPIKICTILQKSNKAAFFL